uniref:Uncharacterized protein n=1 Tax=Romanomermis culicivorax TaxID=13658 RepID=A0A915JQK2_ROMCU
MFSIQENKPVKFSCTILDEAQLNSELETLLPMKYGVEKLILFGSSKSEDKTIFPLKPNLAKHCNFGSLFQRLKLKSLLPVS